MNTPPLPEGTPTAAFGRVGASSAASIHPNDAPVIHLVGAGPGDAELLTVKAVRAIRQATVLLVDDLVGDDVLRYARRAARIVHVGKRGGCASTPQVFIERLMAAEALAGERVVRLKGGDPFVFGRGGEEVAHLQAQGLRVVVVNGITAGLAAATAIGVPLTHRAQAHGVVFVTGHARSDEAALDWPALATVAAQGLTLVIYMGIATIESLQAGLLQGLAGATPVAVVQHASLPQQRHLQCALADLAATVARAGLDSPAIIIVGDVAAAAREMAPPAEAGAQPSPGAGELPSRRVA